MLNKREQQHIFYVLVHSTHWTQTHMANFGAQPQQQRQQQQHRHHHKMARNGEISLSRFSHMYPMLVAPLPTPPPLQRFTEIVVLQTTNIEYNPKSTNTFLLHLFILELFPIHFSTLSFSSAFLSYSPPALSFQNPTHPLWSHARSLIFRTNMHRHPAFFFISFHLLSLCLPVSHSVCE